MLNRHEIIGRLGKDPEIRYLPSGQAVANFSVATTEKWKDKVTGEPTEATEWHRCSAFDRLAEICGEYLKQGTLIYVSGKSKTRKYTGSDNVERYSTEINITEMKILSTPQGNDGQQQAPAPRQAPQQPRQAPQGGRTAPSQRQAPAGRGAAPQRQQQPRPASGFDDMDDDIPY